MKKMQLIILLMFLFLAPSFAQSIGGGLMVGVPQNEYRDFNPDNGYGLQIQGMLISPDEWSPFGFGIDAGFLIYSSDTERRPFSYTIPDIGVDVRRTNSMANFHFVFQVSPFFGKIRPYAEALGGGAYYFTTTEVTSDYFDEHIASEVNYDDFAWSYGGSAGIKILLSEPEESNMTELLLDIKVRYLNGSRAEYLTKDDVVINDRTHTVTYFPRKSKTDMLTFSIGVEARF